MSSSAPDTQLGSSARHYAVQEELVGSSDDFGAQPADTQQSFFLEPAEAAVTAAALRRATFGMVPPTADEDEDDLESNSDSDVSSMFESDQTYEAAKATARKVLTAKHRSWRHRLKDVFEGNPHDRDAALAVLVNVIVLAAITASCVIFCIESLPSFYARRASGLNDLRTSGIFWAETICILIFVIEATLRVLVVPVKDLKSIFFLVDIISILGYFVDLILDSTGTSNFSGFSVVRSLRLIRVFRVFKLSRYSRSLQLVFVVLRSSASGLTILLVPLFLTVIFFSTAMYFFEVSELSWDEKRRRWSEPDGRPGLIQSIPDAIWFSMATITTVGYGDVYPKTVGGKIVAVMIQFVGVLTLSFPNIVLGGNLQFAFKSYNRSQARKKLGRKFRKVYRCLGFVNLLRNLAAERKAAKQLAAVVQTPGASGTGSIDLTSASAFPSSPPPPPPPASAASGAEVTYDKIIEFTGDDSSSNHNPLGLENGGADNSTDGGGGGGSSSAGVSDTLPMNSAPDSHGSPASVGAFSGSSGSPQGDLMRVTAADGGLGVPGAHLRAVMHQVRSLGRLRLPTNFLFTKAEFDLFKKEGVPHITNKTVREWSYRGIRAITFLQRVLELSSGVCTTEEMFKHYGALPAKAAAAAAATGGDAILTIGNGDEGSTTASSSKGNGAGAGGTKKHHGRVHLKDLAVVALYLAEGGYLQIFFFRRTSTIMLVALTQQAVNELLLHPEEGAVTCIRSAEVARYVWRRTTNTTVSFSLQPLFSTYLRWSMSEKKVDDALHTPNTDFKVTAGSAGPPAAAAVPGASPFGEDHPVFSSAGVAATSGGGVKTPPFATTGSGSGCSPILPSVPALITSPPIASSAQHPFDADDAPNQRLSSPTRGSNALTAPTPLHAAAATAGIVPHDLLNASHGDAQLSLTPRRPLPALTTCDDAKLRLRVLLQQQQDFIAALRREVAVHSSGEVGGP